MGKSKKKQPQIVKAHPRARSFRSMALGWCTLLFDADHEATFRGLGFNPFLASRAGAPRDAHATMQALAERGAWFAVESHPEIVDADGVPGLDLIPPNGPDDDERALEGQWFESGSQLLHIPSGNLLIAYEQEFFDDRYLDESPTFNAADPSVESLSDVEFCNATSYLLTIEPGYYMGRAFTRNVAADQDTDGRHADLVITLRPTQQQSLAGAKPLIPYSG